MSADARMVFLRAIAGLSVVCASARPVAAQADPPPTVRLVAATDSLLGDLHARGLFDGAVVLGGDRELYARGFGFANREAGLALTPDTPIDGASIAKTFTAATALLLAREGRLDLDAPVQRLVSEYPHSGTTLRHLLMHSAGLPAAEYDYFAELIPPDTVRTTSLLLRVLRDRAEPRDFEPGTAFRYSSLGYDVVALAAERATGRPWEAFLRERIFEPLGMRHSFLRPARLADWRGVRALSYARSGDSLVVDDVFDNEGFYGGSNLYSSARDLFLWSRSFYAHPLPDSATLAVGDEAPSFSDPTSGRSGTSALTLLSWYHDGEGARFHYPGSLKGFWSSVYRDEARRYSVVWVSNNSVPQWLRPLLSRALIDVMEGRRPAIVAPSYTPLTRANIDAVAGSYRVEGLGTIRIRRDTGRTYVAVGDGIEYAAFAVGDGQLYIPGRDVWIGFPADGARAFERVLWLSIYQVAEGRRIP